MEALRAFDSIAMVADMTIRFNRGKRAARA